MLDRSRPTGAPAAAEAARQAPAIVHRISDAPLTRVSVVVPVRNEAENIAPMLGEFAGLAELLPLGEVIYVDDGSTDDTLLRLEAALPDYPFLRIVRHPESAGQSAATYTGVRSARYELVVTIDGDGQNDPADIEKLYACFAEHAAAGEALMVMGQRTKRRDSLVRRLSSRIANSVRSKLLRDSTRDTGCSLKMFRRSQFLELPSFDHMHRFLPALMNRQGIRVRHVDVSHRPRTHGRSKYGTWDRLWVGIVDLAGVIWLQRRALRARDIIED